MNSWSMTIIKELSLLHPVEEARSIYPRSTNRDMGEDVHNSPGSVERRVARLQARVVIFQGALMIDPGRSTKEDLTKTTTCVRFV